MNEACRHFCGTFGVKSSPVRRWQSHCSTLDRSYKYRFLNELENGESGIAELVNNLKVSGIGDSVMLGAAHDLYKKFPNGYFDAKISRSTWEASKIVNDADFDTEVTENINYFEDAFKKIDEDRLNFEKSGGKEEEEIEEKSEKEQSTDMSNVGQVEVTEEPVQKETVVETKKISFFDRLLQLI